jgi:phosphatidylserine decarboxylase
MAKDVYKFLIPLLGILLLFSALGLWIHPLLWIPAVLTFMFFSFVAYFFRDPERKADPDSTSIVSPVDGKVVNIEQNEDGCRISIFLSVFNVHVNRAPIGGKIVRQEYRPGKFLVAWDEKASVENEQVQMTFEGIRTIKISLIAGIIARRVLPYTKLGDTVAKGDRIALIRFGSRADVFIPSDCTIVTRKGEHVKGGLSVLASTGE